MTEQNAKKKIEVKDATKIFGRNSKRAAQLLGEGKTKEEILKAYRCNDWCKQCII